MPFSTHTWVARPHFHHLNPALVLLSKNRIISKTTTIPSQQISRNRVVKSQHSLSQGVQRPKEQVSLLTKAPRMQRERRVGINVYSVRRTRLGKLSRIKATSITQFPSHVVATIRSTTLRILAEPATWTKALKRRRSTGHQQSRSRHNKIGS